MKLGHIITIIVLGVVLAVVLSFYGDRSYYVTFEQAEVFAAKKSQKDYHVVVKIDKDKPQEYDPIKDPNYFSFYGTDTLGVERQIVYNGAKPTDLDRTDKIVVIGKAEGDYFHAVDILKKCPSKYEAEGVK
ncbi:MAG: cytochrome c maturation protein CcmE [Bacteroidia bacterium]|nr:cytochrome c maturation protein CcmE [Bacteroidia bacterium]MCO5254656.1 cytochrome c maturation protein CcmE [Bacteroidota bacterium]MCZ2129425.1 cytochrome c maturation protein CcmE [Bacteroidia bacterium]